ncbi:MAG: ABC transporter ATP-binding protein [Rhodospirillaceae bacterium]|nr:ABC transporter ATP-binding protein [Rhodospirillaceae bacterium]
MSAPNDGKPSGPESRADGLHMINVSHAFDDHQVVRGVSVFVEPGELVCLLGPSGCGKTTLLRLAAGLEELQVGRITMGDDVVADGQGGPQLPPEKRNVGLMFQDFALFPHLTVFENIVFGLNDRDKTRREWARETLSTMGLADYADAFPHVLSGGQQQRVALLRALAPAPRVLLLDEPFSGLDVNRRAQIRQDTFQILTDLGIATLMVTHDPEEAMFMADRILVMQDGRIVQSGQPVDIYFHPETAFVAELFGPVNRLECRIENGMLTSPLGRHPAPEGIAAGAPLELLIRPEALNLAPLPAGGAAEEETLLTVLSARSLGRSTHLTLHLDDGAGGTMLNARMPGVFLPEIGTRVTARVAPENLLVFAKQDA